MNESLRERALRMLARREYSRHELAAKLGALAGSADQMASLLDQLAASGLLSDERYASVRARSRGSRLGDSRIARELRARGVDDRLIAQALATVEDELTRARHVWRKRYGDPLPVATGDVAERARQYRFLVSRGFSHETIRRLIGADFEDDEVCPTGRAD
ncbi:recombination regulator RecX [Accumulibacter sp.]|uniref:recombination regulator RecX n=1 Tax=Accumulibacter sp. TaxID=2053492 RepID=UPI0025E22460|nr:recombination regulator RecX [Accumulibacter sp.]MCM8593834.1 recombination regulator RecX [Accumulibacter sp.]MCM8626124.1 recombination regulator RecX [Accumulibacter sp.]MDS4047975.1 recombination regulator RecX [Accumulibacter sp.]